MNFNMLCSLIAARNCYDGGQTVKAIALSAGKSQSTVYRWLAMTKGRAHDRN